MSTETIIRPRTFAAQVVHIEEMDVMQQRLALWYIERAMDAVNAIPGLHRYEHGHSRVARKLLENAQDQFSHLPPIGGEM